MFFLYNFATLQNDYFDDDEDDYNEVDDGGEGRHIYRHFVTFDLSFGVVTCVK